MRSNVKDSAIQLIAAVIAVMFFYAVVLKLGNYEEATREMRNQVFPMATADVLVWLIPLLEIVIIALLIYQPLRKVGLWASLALLLSFSAYIILAERKIFGRTPCSCAGILWQHSTYRHQLWFNVLFIILAIIALVLHYVNNRAKTK